jgi:hypothetical protein
VSATRPACTCSKTHVLLSTRRRPNNQNYCPFDAHVAQLAIGEFTLHIELTRLPHSASVQPSCGKVSSMTCLEHTTLGENTHAKQLFHRASMVNAVALMSVAA